MQFQSFSPTAQQLDSFRKGRKSFACTKKGPKSSGGFCCWVQNKPLFFDTMSALKKMSSIYKQLKNRSHKDKKQQ